MVQFRIQAGGPQGALPMSFHILYKRTHELFHAITTTEHFRGITALEGVYKLHPSSFYQLNNLIPSPHGLVEMDLISELDFPDCVVIITEQQFALKFKNAFFPIKLEELFDTLKRIDQGFSMCNLCGAFIPEECFCPTCDMIPLPPNKR